MLSERCYTPAVFQTEAGAGYFLGKQLAEVGGVGLADLSGLVLLDNMDLVGYWRIWNCCYLVGLLVP